MSCNFSAQHYKEILEIGLKHGYQFIRYDELAQTTQDEKVCILRHDVDYMPEWSVHFAQIEKDLNIRSTYFFQICAKTYNVRESHNYQMVHQLRDWGNEIGLHFDVTWPADPAWEELAILCYADKNVFEAILGFEPIPIVSFHNPHRYVDKIVNQDVPGIRHTYEKRFFSDIKYLSDSQGWYEGCMCQIFAAEKYPKIQLCTHPYIWPEKATGDFVGDMVQMIQGRAGELAHYLCTFHPVCKKNEKRLLEELKKTQPREGSDLPDN